VLRTVDRISQRRNGELGVAGIAVNRLGRTRDARYWYAQLAEQYPDRVLPPIHLRAAIAEAAAQSLPIHALGSRSGAPEAAEEFDALLADIFSVEVLSDGVPDAVRPTTLASRPQLADDAAAPIDALLGVSDAPEAATTDRPPGPAAAEPAAGPSVATTERSSARVPVDDEIEVVGVGDRGRPRVALLAIALIVALLVLAWVRRRAPRR
jgi:hypothetical protein